MRDRESQTHYRERLREQLISAAGAILCSDGLSALQARRVAADSGCSVGTVYNIFRDIDGLIIAANQRTLSALGERLVTAADAARALPLAGRLMALASAYLDFATENPQRWRAVFEHRLSDGEVVPEYYASDRRRLLGLIAEELVPAIGDASARDDAAYALFSAVHGIVQLSLDEKLETFDVEVCRRRIGFIVENVTSALTGTVAA